MSATIFNEELLFTGQPFTVDERVVCPVCKDLNNLPTLRGSAWYDPYLMGENGHMGQYVHYGCLSDKRAAEVKADGY